MLLYIINNKAVTWNVGENRMGKKNKSEGERRSAVGGHRIVKFRLEKMVTCKPRLVGLNELAKRIWWMGSFQALGPGSAES